LSVVFVLYSGNLIGGEAENCRKRHSALKDKIECYVGARAELIHHGKDIARFERIKEEARGRFRKDTIKTYECGRYISDVKKTPPLVDSKGACAGKWNARIYAAREYYRLRCKIKFPTTDKAVRKELASVKRLKGEFEACVTGYFSGGKSNGRVFSHQKLFDFYSVGSSYDSFKKVFAKEQALYKKKYERDWLALAESCKRDLIKLRETKGMEYIRRNRVTCAVR